MSGIPYIYDSPNLFDAYEIEYDESDYQFVDDDYDSEYYELCERIREHLIEEKMLLERIKLMEVAWWNSRNI